MAKILELKAIVPDTFDQIAFEDHIRRHFWLYVRSPQILSGKMLPVFESDRVALAERGIDVRKYDY